MTKADHWLSFPDAPRIRHIPPGPRSSELLETQRRLETDAVVYPRYFPIAPAKAQGATIEDVDGNRFIDWVSGISVLNLGHRHPRVQAAVEKQLGRIWHALELPTEARIDFLEELDRSLPGKMRHHSRAMFAVSGGDAVEAAVSLADFAQHRKGTIAFTGAYHGVHGGAVNLTAGRRYRSSSAFRTGSVVRVPYPDPFRPVLDTDGGCQNLMRYLESIVRDPYSGVDEVSSVVVEPILGEGGYVVPPDDFLPSLREFCDRHAILLIADEIQTGMGRTGRMWAVEHSKVIPDIICIAKTVGGGIPLGVVAYREDLVKELPPAFHLGTFRANALALAAGAEVLRVLKEGDLLDQTVRRGEETMRRFREIAHTHPVIGNVRGRGFMIGVDFVRDPPGRTPFPERAKAIRAELVKRGVLMHTCGSYENVLRFMAPLIIEDELISRGLDIFEEAVAVLDEIPGVPHKRPPAGTVIPVPEPVPGPRIPGPLPPHPVPPMPGRSLD
jgi:4-aminobutyrate aminotransferase-like enzyme